MQPAPGVIRPGVDVVGAVLGALAIQRRQIEKLSKYLTSAFLANIAPAFYVNITNLQIFTILQKKRQNRVIFCNNAKMN